MIQVSKVDDVGAGTGNRKLSVARKARQGRLDLAVSAVGVSYRKVSRTSSEVRRWASRGPSSA